MRSTFKIAAIGAAVVGTTMLMTREVISQEDSGYNKEAMEQMMMAAMKPGPQHKRMARQAGKWTQTAKHWDMEAPSAEPTVNTSRFELESILGGRYLVETLKGTMIMHGEELDFEGFGLFGFDNMRQKHFFIWLDNFGTGYMLGEGDADESGDVITYFSEMEWGGQDMKFKSVSTVVNDDENTFEMYVQTPDGWWKNMEMHSQRVSKKY